MIRRIGAVVLAAPLAMSVPILGAAMPADAASAGITSPSNNASVSHGTKVRVTASTPWGKWRLVVEQPGGTQTTIASKGGWSKTLSSDAAIANNGNYTVRLQEYRWFAWHEEDTRTFRVRVRPAAPSGLSANASGGKLTVRWNLGLENDLKGYKVSAGSGRSKSGSAGSLCSGTSCSASFSLPSSVSGTVPVSVRAQRSNGAGGSLYSSSASTQVSIAGGSTAPPPSSSVPPSYPSGSTPPGATTPLTPFNNESPVTLPSVQPNGATPGFTYPTPQVANQTKPRAENMAATDRLQWSKSIGIALILLIVAAHLGTWTRHLRVSQAGVSRKGMAARIARGGSGRTRVRKAREHIARAEAIAKSPVSLDKPGVKKARSGDTAVLDAPGSPKQANGANGKVGRRPATLGKRSSTTSGVNVRIGPSGASASPDQHDPKGNRATTRSRRGARRRTS